MIQHQCSIYILYNQEGVVDYVGRARTDRFKIRMSEHRQVLGYQPKFEVIDTCTTDCRNVEKKWINQYREQGYNLRNIHWGQGPHFLPDSAKENLRQKFLGRKVTWADKISQSQKGQQRGWSDEGKKKIEAVQFKPGHVFTGEIHERNVRNLTAALNTPEAKAVASKASKSFWDNLTPEAKAEFVKRRGVSRRGMRYKRANENQ